MDTGWKLAAVIALCIGVVGFQYFPCAKEDTKEITYVAAVVEYNPGGASVLAQIENVEKYADFVKLAKAKGADIIVFPEYALTTTDPYNKKALALAIGQIVADPKENVVPCDWDERSKEIDVIKKLSCTAKNNQIYMAVNLIEKFEQASNGESLAYNTNVVFDRKGTIVARYRKFNLFGEVALSTTASPEFSTFKTDFGLTFGVLTCFDLMFHTPAVDLVKKYKVDGIVFSTAWFSELPFLTAAQAQAAWAEGFKVDLLAAGYNFPAGGSTGSGIYWNGKFNSTMASVEGSKMLISHVRSKILHSEVESSCGYKTYEENLANYETVPLKNSDVLETEILCSNGFCCQVDYKIENKVEGPFHYHLLVFSGERTHAKTYKGNMQVCGIVACSSGEKQSCAHNFSQSEYSKNVKFSHLQVKANFTSDYVLPNTLESTYCGPMRPEVFELESNGAEHSLKLFPKKYAIHTFALYSHGF